MNEDIENLYGEFIREGQIIIVQIRKAKGIGETSEEKLKELTDVLVNGYG
jgi:hypothetical protein